MRSVTINGVRSFAITVTEAYDLDHYLIMAEDAIEPEGDCPAYAELLDIFQTWDPINVELRRGLYEVGPVFNLASLTAGEGWEENVANAAYVAARQAQLRNPELAPLLEQGFYAIVPDGFDRALQFFSHNIQPLLEGRCPGRGSVWPLVAGAAGLAAIGLTAWGVYKYGIKRKGK